MKKILLSIVMAFACICFTNLKAQVTIGSNSTPDANAVLDLISSGSKGLLLPRLALSATNLASPLSAHTAGMTVYNTATTSGTYAVTPGLYYNDGTKWVRLNFNNWFYMPSIPFDTSTIGDNFTIDLYAEYVKQFVTNTVKSPGAPALPYYPAATDLYYYVTGFDSTVFGGPTVDARYPINGAPSITSSGVMTYHIRANATDNTYINIVFVVK